MSAEVMTRGFAEIEIRSVNEKERSAEFVIATQRGVDMGDGEPEHLLVAGVDLSRFAKNPVVLDSHNRWESTAVVGRADAPYVEGQNLVAKVHFADTSRAEDVWKLVKGKFLRTTSVGYVPRQVTRVMEDEEWIDPANEEFTVKGPAQVVGSWKLYEISMASLPADEDACMRTERIAPVKTPETPASPVPELGKSAPPTPPELPQEIAARAEKARVDSIRAIAPESLRGLADRLALEGKTLDEARAALLVAYAASMPPAGTPDTPAIPPKAEPEDRGAKDLEALDVDALVRCLSGSN